IALAQDVYELEDAERRSTLAVMLASPDLALMYNDEILGKQAEIPAEDLIWAQEYIVGHNQMLAQTVAEIVLQRGKISKVRAEILKILVSRGSSASGVANSLIRASAGKVSKEDILNLASWYDKNSEKALFLICADKEVSQDVKSAALDALAGKGLTVEPGISLIDWVRRNYWEDRARFAYAIGVFSSAEFVDEKELTEAFLTLDEAIKNSDLVQVLIKTENSQIITSLVAKYNEILGLGILIKLLEHDDKNVRISTVKALEKYNDLGALKLIIDHYKKEEDPEVKQVYKDTFWVIRKHEEKV
ncbi:MAG: hypothetical protein KDD56_08315, partial [Bdellovibrionales bacterium]|nr:hypothetical protein [Bdellovibrionales bacterium]